MKKYLKRDKPAAGGYARRTMPDWDASYRDSETALFGDAPNEYVREIVARSDFAAHTALCLADGDGRNSSWLASHGLAVTAVDLSEVATAQARARDAAAGVTVERHVADLAHWTPPPEAYWDSAFLVYLQCESEVRNHAIRTASAALAPGGWFVAEGFARVAGYDGKLGPGKPDLLYDLDELLGVLDGFEIVEALSGRVRLAEGRRHQGLGDVVRIAARKAPG